MNDEQIKHLEFIQNIITRMNTNSFQIKEWTIAIMSAILAIFASTKNHYFILLAILPSILFWFLDTYYLMQERKFRGLYNDVAGNSKNPKEIKLFEIRPDLYVEGEYSYWDVFRSAVIEYFYGLITVFLMVLFLFFQLNQ